MSGTHGYMSVSNPYWKSTRPRNEQILHLDHIKGETPNTEGW
jgi:hypothetical protein